MNEAFSLSNFFRINLFWLAFLVPGFAIVLWQRVKEIAPVTQGPATIVIRSYAITCTLLAPVTLISYLLKLSINPVLYTFFILVLFGFAYIGFTAYRYLGQAHHTPIFRSNSKTSAYLILFIAILLFDFLLSAVVGNYFTGDANLHLAKISQTLEGGPSPIDPLFGQNIDSRYHYNIVHVVHALSSKLTGARVIDSWRYSLSFFRFLIWVAVFAFIEYFFPKRLWRYFLAVAFIFSSFHIYFYATYPNSSQMIVLFTLASIVFLEYLGRSETLDSRAKSLLLLELSAALFLIGFSHPAYALYAVSFFAIALLVMLALKTAKLGQAVSLVPGFAIPLIFPLYSFLLPNNMLESTKQFGVSTTAFIDFFRNQIVAVQFNNGRIDERLILLVLGVVLATLEIKDSRKIAFVLTSLVFPVLILNTPFFLPYLLKIVPLWFIRRLSFTDLLSPVLVFVPFLWLVDIVNEKLKERGSGSRAGAYLSLTVIFLLILPSLGNIATFKSYFRQNLTNYQTLGELASLNKYIIPGKLILSTPEISYLIPAALNSRVLYIKNVDHVNPATPDLRRRSKALSSFFLGTPQIELLQPYLTKPSYVLIARNEKLASGIRKNLIPIKTTKHYRLLRIENL